MTLFIIGFILGIFTGAFIANKTFKTRVITEFKKLAGLTTAKSKQSKTKEETK